MNFKLKLSLSIKIALITGITFMFLFEVFIQFFKSKNIDDFKAYSQERLVEDAKLIAMNIDGDDHKKAIMMNDSAKIYYNKIQKILNKSKISLGMKEEIASIFLHNESTSCYGVMSNVDTVARQGCAFRDTSLKFVFKESFKKNKPISSDIYSDRNGTWLSGFAPILDKQGNVVAVVELDLTLTEYNKKLNEFTNWTTYFRMLGIISSILVGLVLGIFIGNPLSKLSKRMSDLAVQESAEEYKIPFLKRLFPDETTILIDSFNSMSQKLTIVLNELHKANLQLLELDKSKTIFLNLIAHELRTPLTGLGFIDFLIKHNNLNIDDFEALESIQESYIRIKEFSLSAEKYIRSLNYTPNFSEIALVNNVITSVLNNRESNAINKNIKFEYKSTDNIIARIESEILEEIITIIIDNAIKFSKENDIITIITEKNSDSRITISISDNGIGINPENLDKVFDPYFVNDITSHSKGAGVNLAICKSFVCKYTGEIIVNSDGSNTGTTFTLIFHDGMLVN